MTLPRPLRPFGIHNATFKDLVDGTWTMAYLLGSAEIDLAGEQILSRGGSSPYAYDAAPGEATSEISAEIRQYEPGLLRYFTQWDPTAETIEEGGEPNGTVTQLTDFKGTSLTDASTGIASIAVGTASNLLLGNYKIVATAAGTIDIYRDTNVTGNVGFIDDSLKVNDAPITIPAAGTVEFLGVEFTGATGPIAFTVGDEARFSVTPINNFRFQHSIGAPGACGREFELTLYSACKNSGGIATTTFYRCVGSATTSPQYLEKEWSSMSATITVLAPASGPIGKVDFINR